MTRDGKVFLSKIANIDHRLAEIQAEASRLLADRARMFDALSDDGVDITTGRRQRRNPVPEIPPVPELAKARAAEALRETVYRRKFGR